jgi:signal transduction histidine kinase/CheY-like chemotaxis protein
VKRCLATGQRQLAETQVAGRSIVWKFYPIERAHSVHCYAEDITERLTLEAQVRRSQKMESIGQLAAGIAHDFNNILTVIQGHSSLLLQDLNADDKAHESLGHICVAAERAANLTRQLLLFSRKQLAQPRTLDLNDVIENVAAMLRVLLGDSVTVDLQLASDLPAVDVDEGMMEQVLMNLAVNSRDAMPRGGRLSLRTMDRRVDEKYARRLREARAGHFVVLRVSDTGTGMTRETLAHIFEPFFTTKDVGKGTGLGLATVYGIVKQHHGWIEVETKEGAGTTFTVMLPASDRPAEKLAKPSGDLDNLPRGTETILVVEDEEPLRNLVTLVLRHAGYTVYNASTGAEALEVWRRHRREIDLLFTDVMMPEGMSGRELAEKILASERDLRVMLTSGYPMEAIGSDVAKGGHCFLQKPYSPGVLAQAVRECLDRRPRSRKHAPPEVAHAR